MTAYDWRALVAATDYDRRARMHAPTDSTVLTAEIRRLRQTGLTARDIANTLRLDMGAVLTALRTDTTPPRGSTP